ncbi:DUF4365 domain-containing protein [Metasolibacillus sp. FSL K6-0083]|uniref:DUF4365 domain-containing protein n=1 Tax=Bacillales TaxID=1385 RepID=UPI00315ACEEE
MKKRKISELNKLQVGRFGEYATKMEFTLYGCDVYTSEVDDKAIDFIIRKDGQYYDIQVKTCRKLSYVFLQKHVFTLRNNVFLALVFLHEDKAPDFYLIPSTVWEHPDEVFVSRDYDQEGQKSKAEWGINLSKKNLPRLEAYRFENSDFFK